MTKIPSATETRITGVEWQETAGYTTLQGRPIYVNRPFAWVPVKYDPDTDEHIILTIK
jgi:hypothetical protein